MFMRILMFFIIVINAFSVFSQEQLVFATKEKNFGAIVEFKPLSFQFEFINESEDTINFAPLPMTNSIALQLDDNKILPSQASKITLVYFSNRTGRFNENIYLTTNKNQIIKLEIKGIIESFSKDNIVNNPIFEDFNNQQVKSVSGEKDIQFIIIDDVSMKPIPYAKVILKSVKTSNSYIGLSDQTGVIINRIPDGQYSIECLLEGYVKEINKTRVDEYNNTVLVLVSKKTTKEDLVKRFAARHKKKPLINTDTIITPQKEVEIIAPEIVETPIEPIVQTPLKQRKSLNIILLLDVSTSMEKSNRIGVLKNNLKTLIDAYEPDDKVSILLFNETVQSIYESKNVENKEELKKTIDEIKVSGNTDGILAVDKAFQLMEENHKEDYHNMIILATDGKITSNPMEDKAINLKIQDMNLKGFLFSIVGFGSSQYDLMKLEKMANLGGGLFLKISDTQNAQDHLLLDEIYKTLVQIK